MDTTKIVEKIKYGNVELKLKTENLQEKTVDPSTEVQTILPDHEYGGMSAVTINAVTSDIDANIIPENIKDGVVILGVEGSLGELEGELLITENGIYDVRDYATANVKTEGKEDLDTELNEQEELLAELESSVEELQEKPVDKLQWKCDNMKSLSQEFFNYQGESLEILNGLDTSKVTDTSSMFYYCHNLETVPLFDTSNVTNMYRMFASGNGYASGGVKFIPLFNTSKVTNMSSMFYGCSNLIEIPLLDTSNVETMETMFHNCSLITTIPLFNTSKVTDMSSMFSRCFELTEIPLLDTSSVTSMRNMFASCYVLTSIPKLNTAKVTRMEGMFSNCEKLETVTELDLIKVTNVGSMFKGCYKLTNLTLKNIKKSLQIGSGTTWCHLLTDASIINTFQELWDLTGSSTQTLTLSTPSLARTGEIYVKLIDVTDAMREEDEYIDNKKPCVVCESTDAGAMTLREYGISKNWNIA